MSATLPKSERLSGKKAIASLLKNGGWGVCGNYKYCWAKGEEGINRILVSIPKKNFKRAVKRNLLKRRTREAYRTQKELLQAEGVDVMFVYNSQEIATLAQIREDIARILSRIQ